jgi:hypothetical protein
MVSLTAAKTKRILGVSVACVKLSVLKFTMSRRQVEWNVLWVDTQSRAIGLHESP